MARFEDLWGWGPKPNRVDTVEAHRAFQKFVHAEGGRLLAEASRTCLDSYLRQDLCPCLMQVALKESGYVIGNFNPAGLCEALKVLRAARDLY